MFNVKDCSCQTPTTMGLYARTIVSENERHWMSYLLPNTNEKSRRRHMWLYFWERIVCVCANTDAPVISCPQEEFSVSVGDRVVLSCSANANPGSLLTWMRSVDGKFTEHITDPTINISIKVGSLTVASCNATKTRRRFTWSMKTVLILSFFYSEKVLARRFFLISLSHTFFL